MRVGVIIVLCLLCISSYAKEKKFDLHQDTSIVTDIDVAPQFKGGINAWNRFLQNNLNVSNLARDMDSTEYVTYGVKQTAILEFTVCEDGSVCDITVANKDKISPDFAKEVLRVMKRSPKWISATKEGVPVRTKFKQSIMAILD